MNHDQTPASLESRARRRVGMKIGLGVHALVYVLVNAGLFVIDSANGGHGWWRFPLLGWGLGLAIHAVVTFVGLRGDGLHERMMRAEMERLRNRS